MSTVLITGGGRGIGLELARQLLQQPVSRISKIYITTRSPSEQADALVKANPDRLTNINCAVTEQDSVKKAAAELDKYLDGKGLDVLINNVGILTSAPGGVETMEATQLAEAFQTNVISAQMVTSAMLPALRRSTEKKIVMMSTTLGSFAYAEKFRAGRAYPYKITKAAMNMLMLQYALDLEKEGFTVIGTSPGWLKTDLGSQYADLEVSVGVEATLKNILGATTKDNGRFLDVLVPGWEHAEGLNQYPGGDAPW